MSDTVLVSGGSGYIAGFIIRQLVAAGWMVHTTVRNLAREGEVRGWLDVDNAKLKFFAADLTSDAGWATAMAGCSHVCHVASPFPTSAPKHNDELIVPARDGVLRALQFAKAAGVTRFVQTSSVAAISYGHANKTCFTEADWTDSTSPDTYAYVKSKTIAERAARDWVAENGGNMEFCSVNPSLVLGPLLAPDYSTSLEAIKKLLDGEIPAIPDLGFGIVDVRDVADLHVQCLTAPNMAGERFIASGPFTHLTTVAAILKSEFGPKARKVPTRRLPSWMMRVAANFDPLLKQVKGELGIVRDYDPSHARAVLGWETRPVRDSIIDTAHSLIEHGVVRV